MLLVYRRAHIPETRLTLGWRLHPCTSNKWTLDVLSSLKNHFGCHPRSPQSDLSANLFITIPEPMMNKPEYLKHQSKVITPMLGCITLPSQTHSFSPLLTPSQRIPSSLPFVHCPCTSPWGFCDTESWLYPPLPTTAIAPMASREASPAHLAVGALILGSIR